MNDIFQNPSQQINQERYSKIISNNNLSNNIIESYFKIIFKHCLISKINYNIFENKVEIKFFYYYIENNNKSNNPIFNKKVIQNLIIILELLYNKKVYIIINRVHYPYINAQIISEYLGIKSETNTFINFKRSIIKNTVLQINNLPAFIVGIKIQVHGRLITERLIPRKTEKYKIIGTFTINNIKTIHKNIIICKGQINIKNELGAFTITVELAQIYK